MAASKQSSYILMQNCDLPPPTKLVSGPDGPTFMSSISKIYDMDAPCEHTEILKALQRSQTRAAEAERQLRILSEFKEALSGMLVDESMILFAHRQWVNLLEVRVLKLERERGEEEGERRDCEEGRSGKKWCGAVALCLVIAFSCRYLL